MAYIDRCHLEVDLNKVRKNVKKINKFIGDTKLMSVVKSNAYGMGLVPCAKAIEELTDWYGVATAEEALTLRQQGISKPILVFGYVSEEVLPEIIDQQITITTVSLDYIRNLEQLIPAGKQLMVHIKIDTGLNRIGLFSQTNEIADYVAQAKAIFGMEQVLVTGIYTHFAVAGSEEVTDVLFTKNQYALFEQVYRKLIEDGYDVGIKHCCNSNAIVANPELYLDMVRTGKYLFGFGQQAELDLLGVAVAFRLQARVLRIEEIKPGDSVGYGRTFQAKGPTKIATISFGFADGYRRSMGSDLEVLIHGERVPIVGRIAMDFLMVDVTEASQVTVGDYVTLIGSDGDDAIMPYEVSRGINGSTPEIPSQLNKRVNRSYLEVTG